MVFLEHLPDAFGVSGRDRVFEVASPQQPYAVTRMMFQGATSQ
jgi:hypothetical protein